MYFLVLTTPIQISLDIIFDTVPTILPVSNLGLIIVDEEHETGYQEKNSPHFNSRDCLMIRAQNYKIPIVLGSATPTVNTYYLFKKNNWPTDPKVIFTSNSYDADDFFKIWAAEKIQKKK